MRRRLGVLAAAGLAVLAAGCAIPTQNAPVSIAPSKVPFNLLNPHPPTTTTTTQPKPPSYVSVKVFFLDVNNLEPESRYVASPAPLQSILDALVAGPTPSEATNGITTAIPSDVSVLTVTTQPNNIVVVNLNSAFLEITGTDIELAVGQIVATVSTATSFGTGVIFEIDGSRTTVPIASGAEVAGPVYLIEFLNTAP